MPNARVVHESMLDRRLFVEFLVLAVCYLLRGNNYNRSFTLSMERRGQESPLVDEQ